MKPDHLDAAIDQVAARLLAPQGDDNELARRIVTSLPERSSRLRWLIPQLAAISAIAIASLVWTLSADRAVPDVLSSNEVGPIAAFVTPVSERVPQLETPRTQNPATGRTQRLEPLELLEPLEPLEPSDHERSLPGIPALKPLDVAPIEISSIGVDNK